jgi:hypothetical protein
MSSASSVNESVERATVPSSDRVLGSNNTRGSAVKDDCMCKTDWFCSPSFLKKKYLLPSLNGVVYRS